MVDKGFTNDAIPALGACESPIESKFVQAFFDYFRVEEYEMRYLQDDTNTTRLIAKFTRGPLPWRMEYFLGIQSSQLWGRVDFVLCAHWHKTDTFDRIMIELDGSRFHSSAEQQARDRAKDRQAAQQGCIVVRFSGSEVYRSPHEVVVECLAILNARLELKLEDESEQYWRGHANALSSLNASEAAE